MDELCAYVRALDRIIADSRLGDHHTATRLMLSLPKPAASLLDGQRLLDRKRNELFEHCQQLRQQWLHLPANDASRLLEAFGELARHARADTIRACRQEGSNINGQMIQPMIFKTADWIDNTRAIAAHEGPFDSLHCHNVSDGSTACLHLASAWLYLRAPQPCMLGFQRILDDAELGTPLSVRIQPDYTRLCLEGGVMPLRLTLRNQSEDVLLLSGLDCAPLSTPPESWIRHIHGQVVHALEPHNLTIQVDNASGTPIMLHLATLRPRQERSLLLQVRFHCSGDHWRQFGIEYIRLSLTDFQSKAFIQWPPGESFYCAGLRFRRAQESEPAAALNAPAVYLPHAKAEVTRTQRFAYPFYVLRGPFPLERAHAIAGPSSEFLYYSQWQNAWIARIKGVVTIVTEERCMPCPSIDSAVFEFVDAHQLAIPVLITPQSLARINQETSLALQPSPYAWEHVHSLSRATLAAVLNWAIAQNCPVRVDKPSLNRSALLLG